MAQESLTEAPHMSPPEADPSLSRNSSFSRLNAQAPEFVPTRATTRTDLQHPRLVLPTPSPPPPPPPSGMVHVYPPSPTSPFHLPIQGHGPVSSQVVPVQNHHHRLTHQQHVPVHYRSHHPHQYYVSTDSGVKQVQQSHVEPDHVSSSKGKPSEDASQKILNQVEYYFSDLNLATTDHLMRFINKDPEGFVPIFVVASFKKIKALISSHSQLATVLRNSSKLVVSEDGKKVKRQYPLTESDIEELQSRIVVAENLPEDHCHQNLMKVFSGVGSVKTIRTCPPQTSNSGTSSSARLGKVDVHLSNKLHAFVEYESVELAERAVAELNDERNWRNGLRVRLMLRHMSKPAQGRAKKGFDVEVNCEEEYTSVPEQLASEKLLDDASVPGPQLHEHVEEHGYDRESGGQRKGRSRGGRGKGRGRVHGHQNSRVNQSATPPSNNSILTEQVVVKQPPGPRMPDGTRGFSMGRGKPVAANIA